MFCTTECTKALTNLEHSKTRCFRCLTIANLHFSKKNKGLQAQHIQTHREDREKMFQGRFLPRVAQPLILWSSHPTMPWKLKTVSKWWHSSATLTSLRMICSMKTWERTGRSPTLSNLPQDQEHRDQATLSHKSCLSMRKNLTTNETNDELERSHILITKCI